jgi:hypothetical protein
VLGQALTGGRTGYGVWALLGITFGLLRWRRALPLIPIVAVIVLTLLPGVSQRLFQGFAGRQGAMQIESDEYQITSGRNLIWPYVVDEIKKAPVFGHGRLAMNRIGLDEFLLTELKEDFSHPHNAYLEMLLDNGIVGLLLVMSFYVMVVWRSVVLFMDRADNLAAAVGGASLALVLALLLAAIGSQTFYPREGSVGMWAMIGIMLRVSVEKKKAAGEAIFPAGVDGSATGKEPLRLPRPRWAAAPVHGSVAARQWAPAVGAGSGGHSPVRGPATPAGVARSGAMRRFLLQGPRYGQKWR